MLIDDVSVVQAEANVPMSKDTAMHFLATVRGLGKRLRRIYERQCNGHQTLAGGWDAEAAHRDEEAEEKIEAQLRSLFNAYGLGLYINEDPRGAPIGILTPKSGKCNTMGGREAGWRL